MDNNFNSEATSSSCQIYKDAFVPQPKPRTKAWERAAVEAHAPRLRGQKIWKKAGIKTPRDDKENFETALAELEKGGTGSRKKRRVMGAKENISEAQWQMIEEEIPDGNVVVSPRKKGRDSLFPDDKDALLVPRKRTNTNHLITPRKPLRKIPNGSNLEIVVDTNSNMDCLAKDSEKKHDSPMKFTDGTNSLLSSDKKILGTTNRPSEKHEHRRKSLRRCSRRLTQTNEQVLQETAKLTNRPSTSLSVVVWSAPAFEIFQTQNVHQLETQTMEGTVSKSVQEQVLDRTVPEDVSSDAKGESESSLEDLQRAPAETLNTTSAEGCILAPLVIEQDLLAFDNGSLEVSTSAPDFTIASQEATSPTPNRASNTESAVLDSVRNHQSKASMASTRSMTPKSTKSTPRVGLRRSLRTPRTKSFTFSTVEAAPEEAAMTEMRPLVEAAPVNEATSSVLAYAAIAVQAEAESRVVDEPAALFQEAETTSDIPVIPGDEDPIPCVIGSMEDTNPETDKDVASLCSTSTGTVLEDLEPEPYSNAALSFDLLSPSRAQTESPNDMVLDSPIVSLTISPSDDASSLVAQCTTISMDHIVNLFPAAQSDKSESCEVQTESFHPEEEHETLDTVSFSLVTHTNGDEHAEQQPNNDATSSLATAPVEEAQEFSSRPLVDHDDTDLLRDFVTRVKASKAAKASTSIPRRKRSLPHSPLRIPLGGETNSPPSGDTKDDEFDFGESTSPPSKRRKCNDPSLETDELAAPTSPRRSRRTRLPVKKSLAAPSFIPVRRLGQEGENTVTLRQSEEKELAALTRFNTRKNKGAAVFPAKILAMKAEEKYDPASRHKALKEVFDQKKKGDKKGKSVVWAEQLARFQTDEVKKEVLEPEVENAKVPEEKKAVKVGMRSKMSLGMAVNGTPAPKRKVRGRRP